MDPMATTMGIGAIIRNSGTLGPNLGPNRILPTSGAATIQSTEMSAKGAVNRKVLRRINATAFSGDSCARRLMCGKIAVVKGNTRCV